MPALSDLDVQYVSLVDRAAVRDPADPDQPQRFLVWKAESGAPTTTPGGTVSETELRAALTKTEGERDTLKERVDALEKAAEKAAENKDEPAAIDKAELPAPVREALEKAEADRVEARKAAERAEEIAKTERDLRITREFVAKAEGLSYVAGDTAEFGALLKSASESLAKDDFDRLEKRLRAADEQLKTSALLKSFGSDGDGRLRSDGEDEFVAKADEIRKSDPSLTRSEAMRQAMRDPAVVSAYLANR